jgi:hypothetical protein
MTGHGRANKYELPALDGCLLRRPRTGARFSTEEIALAAYHFKGGNCG